MMKETITGIVVIILAMVLIMIFKSVSQNKNQAISPQAVSSTPPAKNLAKPSMSIDKTKKYQAILKTSVGDITIDFTASDTPITVNNFVYLAKNNFYNNTIFHRVIKGFMIQGGDPKGDGTGGPGYKFDDEQFSGEYTRGTVAMANAGPNTNGSQFFIMQADNLTMPKNYIIFGHVSAGMDVIDKIAGAPIVMSSMGELSKPVNPVTVQSVQIVENPS